MKKKVSFFMALLVCLNLIVPASAAENTPNAPIESYIENINVEIDDGEEYLKDYLWIENGVAYPITQAELDEILSNDPIDCIPREMLPQPLSLTFDDIYTFNITSTSTQVFKDLSKPVSTWVDFGPAGGNISATIEETFSRNYSSNVTYGMRNGITGAIGVAYSITNTIGVTATLGVEGNCRARLRFAPECDKYAGNVEHRSWNYDYIETIYNVVVYQPTITKNGLLYLEYA